MPKSFNTVLRLYKKSSGLSSDNAAHVQRWLEDNRAEEVWRKIRRAAQQNKKLIPAEYFITEILATKRVAMAIGLRGKLRERYRKVADEMERIAKFLRKPPPFGMPPYPPGTQLARMLDDAAGYFRRRVESTRNIAGALKFSRQSKPHMVFMSMLGNDLKSLTGCWLDEEVAVLAEIAFDSSDVIDVEAARWVRRQPRARTTVRNLRR